MMNAIGKRIEAMEKATGTDETALSVFFIHLVKSSHTALPVDGWEIQVKQNQFQEVLRLPGETDEALSARVVALAKELKPDLPRLCFSINRE